MWVIREARHTCGVRASPQQGAAGAAVQVARDELGLGARNLQVAGFVALAGDAQERAPERAAVGGRGGQVLGLSGLGAALGVGAVGRAVGVIGHPRLQVPIAGHVVGRTGRLRR